MKLVSVISLLEARGSFDVNLNDLEISQRHIDVENSVDCQSSVSPLSKKSGVRLEVLWRFRIYFYIWHFALHDEFVQHRAIEVNKQEWD